MSAILDRLKLTFIKFSEDDIFTRAAALSYYSSLALAPLILLFVTILGLLNLNMQDQLIGEVQKLVGIDAAQILKNIIQSTNDEREFASLSGLISLCLLMFSASVIFNQLQKSLDIIFDASEYAPEQETIKEKISFFVNQRLLSLGMVFTFIFIVIISMVASTILAYFFKESSFWFVAPIQISINLLVFLILFTLIIKILPSRSISFKRSLVAGGIISTLFVLGKEFIGIYLANTAIGSSYGAAGSLAIILVWFYYSALIIYFGAELAYTLVIES